MKDKPKRGKNLETNRREIGGKAEGLRTEKATKENEMEGNVLVQKRSSHEDGMNIFESFAIKYTRAI